MKGERYDRQVLLPWIGEEGQRRIASSRVGIVGLGALGSASAALLARAGIGAIFLVDRDFVEESNLQRQTLYTERHARDRIPKTEAASEALLEVRSDLSLAKWNIDLGADEARRLFKSVDLVVDGTDNFETRFLLNDASVESAKPWIYGGVLATRGAVMAIRPGIGPCLRCLFPDLPPPGSAPTCDTAGVLGAAAAAVASFQACEALKLCAGRPDLVLPGILQVDLLEGRARRTAIAPAPTCPCCAARRFDFLEEREGSRTHRICGKDGIMVLAPRGTLVDLCELETRLAAVSPVFRNPYLLQTQWEGHSVTIYSDGRALIQGLDDPARARALYARYLGM